MDDLIDRLAELVVAFGANVQPGQVVSVAAEIGHEAAARALAAAAYRRGARYVDVAYFDPYVKRARILYAPEDTLDYVPPWLGWRLRQLGELRGARISIAGKANIGALEGLDPARLGRDRLPWIDEILEVIDAGTTNWCVAPFPSRAWAQLAHPDLPPDEAYARLSQELAHVCRLDEPDPVAAWEERIRRLDEITAKLDALDLDALHYEGPATSLVVGLFGSARWLAARSRTVDGIEHVANLPTEEVFTTPDPERTEGFVRSTKPLVLPDGTIVRGLHMRFEGGRAVEVDADEGGEVMRTLIETDEGAARLGEVALVDRESRIGQLGTIFYDTLLDENAASHVAVGGGFDEVFADDAEKARRNRSKIHTDFMIGGDDVDVIGLARSGERIPLLRGGAWQI